MGAINLNEPSTEKPFKIISFCVHQKLFSIEWAQNTIDFRSKFPIKIHFKNSNLVFLLVENPVFFFFMDFSQFLMPKKTELDQP